MIAALVLLVQFLERAFWARSSDWLWNCCCSSPSRDTRNRVVLLSHFPIGFQSLWNPISGDAASKLIRASGQEKVASVLATYSFLKHPRILAQGHPHVTHWLCTSLPSPGPSICVGLIMAWSSWGGLPKLLQLVFLEVWCFSEVWCGDQVPSVQKKMGY